MLLMGKSTISMAIFNSFVTNYQRVTDSGFWIFSLDYHPPYPLDDTLWFQPHSMTPQGMFLVVHTHIIVYIKTTKPKKIYIKLYPHLIFLGLIVDIMMQLDRYLSYGG
jgi:hypothetical protein